MDNALSELASESPVISKPSVRYITTMDIPYVIASRNPLVLSFVRFRKKLTVIGMIGHTHGVNRAISPPSNPITKIYHRELFAGVSSCIPNSFMTGFHKSLAMFTTLLSAATLSVFSTFVVSAATTSSAFSSSTGCSSILGASSGPFPV